MTKNPFLLKYLINKHAGFTIFNIFPPCSHLLDPATLIILRNFTPCLYIRAYTLQYFEHNAIKNCKNQLEITYLIATEREKLVYKAI